jgi:hypothetical protein
VAGVGVGGGSTMLRLAFAESPTSGAYTHPTLPGTPSYRICIQSPPGERPSAWAVSPESSTPIAV